MIFNSTTLAGKVANNTLVQVVSKIISTALGLAAVSIMTRYLGSAGFGVYTTIITFVSFFSIIADLGLTLVSSQLLNKPGADQKRVLGNLLGFRLVSAVILVGLAPLVIQFFPYSFDIKSGALLAGLAFLFLSLTQVYVALFQKELRTDRIAIAEIASRAVLLLGTFLAWRLDYGLNGLLWTIVACNLLYFWLHYWYSRQFVKFAPRFELSWWRQILERSWPLLLTTVFNLIYLRADILLLSLLKSQSEVGLYGAAYKVVDVLVTVPFMFAGIMLPILVTRWSSNLKQDWSKALQKMFDLTAILVIPLMVGGYFLAEPIIVLVAGAEFASAGRILQILLLAVGAVFFSCVFTYAIISFDRQKRLIIYYLLTAVTAVPLYFWWITRWSYFGAAWGTFYSETLILLFAAILVKRYSDFWPRLLVSGKSLLAALIMGAAVWQARDFVGRSGWHLLLILVLAIVFYLVLLYGFKGVNKNDLLALVNKNFHN